MDLRRRIEERLTQLVRGRGTLYEAAHYTLLAPAKRIRPLLLLACCQAHGDIPSCALDIACALEMIHTYSLIHDDLPSMDDDTIRRGQPTLHVKYDEATAVLTGDFLLTYAFEVVALADVSDPQCALSLVKALSQASGSSGMVGGQMLDIEKDSNVQRMHVMKTASLFQCAMECGALLTNSAYKKQLMTFGMQFGLLFQLVDDLIDHDHPNGDEAALQQAQLTCSQAKATLNSLSLDKTPLLQLLNQLEKKLKLCLVS